jgi:hypothetical protein
MSKLGALFVTIYYFLIVVCGVGLLAAVQMRAEGGGGNFDTWRLNYHSRLAEAAIIDQRFEEVGKNLQQTQANKIFYEQCLTVFDNTGQPRVQFSMEEVQTARQQYKENWAQIPGDLACLVRSYGLLKYDVEFSEIEVKRLAEKMQKIAEKQKLNDSEFGELIKAHGDFLAYDEMEKSPYWGRVIVLPYDLLILLLVMFMGALGGMVRLLRDYGAVDVPNPSAGAYFFVPLIGSVVAIGGYVLAKSGLLLLSSARNEASLSPFIVSLVGIVSGLLAREVIDTIRTKGEEILRKEEQGSDGEHHKKFEQQKQQDATQAHLKQDATESEIKTTH